MLYRIEADIHGRDPATRLATRRERSAPVVADLEAWLTHNRARVVAKSPLGEALKYIAKYLDGLCRFLTDGRIELDNNPIKWTIRPMDLSRKNTLSAGHVAGAEDWAVIDSLIKSRRFNAVDPHA